MNEFLLTVRRINTCAEKAKTKEDISKIEIICCHIEVVQEIVSVSLGDIRAVEVQAEEHKACPNHDAIVDFADDFLKRSKKYVRRASCM